MPVRHRPCKRIPERATVKQHRERGAFAKYCIRRTERELGEHEFWIIDVEPTKGGFTARVEMHQAGVTFEGCADGQDGVLATWEAMCRLEQALRERRR